MEGDGVVGRGNHQPDSKIKDLLSVSCVACYPPHHVAGTAAVTARVTIQATAHSGPLTRASPTLVNPWGLSLAKWYLVSLSALTRLQFEYLLFFDTHAAAAAAT